LFVSRQTWHKFGRNTLHIQIFSQNRDISRTNKRLSERITSRTFSTCWSSSDVEGRPERGSSSIEVRSPLGYATCRT
jgi:hypothetical protein